MSTATDSTQDTPTGQGRHPMPTAPRTSPS